MVQLLMGLVLGYGIFTENGKSIMNKMGDKLIESGKKVLSKNKKEEEVQNAEETKES